MGKKIKVTRKRGYLIIMVRNKVDIIQRYKDMIFNEQEKYVKLKLKLELLDLKIKYLQEEKEYLRKLK